MSPGASPAAAAVAHESSQPAAQMLLLRKALDAQRQQAAELLRQLEGKGQILDIRV